MPSGMIDGEHGYVFSVLPDRNKPFDSDPAREKIGVKLTIED